VALTNIRFAFGIAVAVALAGCLPASTTPMDAGGDGAAGVTYTKDVQPILAAKCAPCHAGQGLGKHNIATTYADTQKLVESVDSFGCWNDVEMTMPKKVGECALILIMNGRMPMSAGCGGSMPPDPSLCVSAAQQAVIAAWIAAGMPQ
jgi:hypothetical protein